MIHQSFELVDMGDDIIAVPVGDNAINIGGVLKFNKQGGELFELFKNNTLSKAVEILVNKYDNSDVELKEYVNDFIASLKEIGIWTD